MIRQKNAPFVNVVPGGVATMVMPLGPTYHNICLDLGTGGTQIAKSKINRIVLKLNGKIFYDITGARLQARNDYFGFASDAQFLMIDFDDPKAKTTGGMYFGAIGTAAGVSMFTVEITLDATTAANCALQSWSYISEPQPLGIVRCLITTPFFVPGAGKFPTTSPFGPAAAHLIERIYFFNTYMTSLEIKKNGVIIAEQLDKAFNEYEQKFFGKVPQAGLFVYDPSDNNDMSKVLDTSDAQSLYFGVTTSAADTVYMYYENYATLDRI